MHSTKIFSIFKAFYVCYCLLTDCNILCDLIWIELLIKIELQNVIIEKKILLILVQYLPNIYIT